MQRVVAQLLDAQQDDAARGVGESRIGLPYALGKPALGDLRLYAVVLLISPEVLEQLQLRPPSLTCFSAHFTFCMGVCALDGRKLPGSSIGDGGAGRWLLRAKAA